jgi:hypothetical protein
MKEPRIQIPPAIKRNVLAKGLCVCCVCKERGIGINFHHIDGNPANNVEDNVAILCLKEHDQHHRPNAYDRAKHLELGEEKIKEFKREWELTVAECQSENPKVIAVVNMYGKIDNIHSIRFLLQNIESKIIYQRIYHLLTGKPDQWLDNISEEVAWLGKNVKLAPINSPLEIEYCPCCSESLANVLDENVMVHLTANDWKEKSIGAIYINPTNPSIALTISYYDELIFSAHLHKHNGYLHFNSDNFEERTPIKKNPSIRTQATEIIKHVLKTWELENILVGTGDPDTPTLIKDFNLPSIWEKR